MSTIERIITPQVLATTAYPVAQVSEKMVKLDAMELPSDIPPHLQDAWQAMLASTPVNRYPMAHNQTLEAKLREVFAISDTHSVLFGNGSDELIQIILWACARPDAVILAPAPTFVMYEVGAKFLGLRYIGVETHADFSLNLDAMLSAIAEHNPAVIFLANPNNPTGVQYPIAQIEVIIRASQGLVILDEAYLAYSEGSVKHLAEQYDNVLVMRTLSKTGFAGLRFGYLFGNPAWIAEFNKVRPPYNVNVLTQQAILFALTHYADIAAQTEAIKTQREHLFAQLAQWSECRVLPSQANFLLLQVPDADRWFSQLKAAGILVKNLNHAHPLLKNFLRITVSNTQENAQLFRALEKCRAT